MLANEQVIGGRVRALRHAASSSACWSSGSSASRDYAERLLDNLDTLDWSETTKTAQRNWIGRSEGAELDPRSTRRKRHARRHEDVDRVFTTRPDTIFGATYLVLAPEHPLVERITTDEQRDGGRGVPRAGGEAGSRDAQDEPKEKTGVFTGAYAINPPPGARSRSGSPTTC